MPFVSKRKAHQIQALVHANEAKRRKLDAGGVGLVRAESMGGRETGSSVETPCTVPPSPLRIIFAPQSQRPASLHPTRQSRAERRHASRTAATPFVTPAQDTSGPQPVVCKLEPEGASASTDLDNTIDQPTSDVYIDPTPPLRVDAANALRKINNLLHPPRNTGRGYKKCKLANVTRTQYESIAACLRLFLHGNTTFLVASEAAAIGAGRTVWHSRRIRMWVRHFIETGDLPECKTRLSSRSFLKHEDVAGEIKLFLQTKGKYFVANDIVQFLNDPVVRQRLTIPKAVTIRTAQRWLHNMEYRWRNEQPGQYFDGHERGDVVQYRQGVYAPKMKALEPFFVSWDEETGVEKPPHLQAGQRSVVIWYHDTSTFYAHDRQKRGWHLKSACSTLAKKGQGLSAMVSDFVSAEYGFLTSRDEKTNAQKILLAGKNREGYMTNDSICEQFRHAVELVKQEYPNQHHVFVYDNARIHTKRSATAPSAQKMTKNESDFGVLMVDANGKKLKIHMENPRFPDGSEQQLYLPNGKFKGMVALLWERGYDTTGLKAECSGFKCVDTTADCCCRRILYNIVDVAGGQKAILQTLAEQLGTEVIFLPKFHCELNPIEQCWGYAKRLYRMAPPSSLTADVQKNMIHALSRVPLSSIRRFVARSRRFLDAYARGLDGPNAAA
ncbi:hypothetical protein FRC06_006761, partial [Ceratobasidium sp. 370]